MTIREAASRIGKHSDTIRRAIQSGKLASEKVNGIWDITDDALKAYANAQGIAYDVSATAQDHTDAYDEVTRLRMQNEELNRQIEYLKEQMQERNDQIRELQKTLHQAQINLDHNQHLLAYAQLPWWRKLGRKALPATPVDMVDMMAEDENQ